MNKKDEYMNSHAHITQEEIKLLASIASKEGVCEVIDYGIKTKAGTTRKLRLVLESSITVQDYEKIARMMIKQVMTEFGHKEETNIIAVEGYFRMKRISLWERIRKLFKKKTIN